MKEWIKISLILCSFGFFRELRPSEPFVTEFLSNSTFGRNITSDQVNKEIYPFGTYSYLAQLFIVFLITDILRYKPIIIASSCVGLILWSLLLWTKSIAALYGVQICYGFFMASEVAYYTYIYAKVSKDKYQRVTGYTRASLLSGRFIAGILAQILISFKLMDERELNYISLGAQGASFIVSLFLPSVGISLYMWSVETKNANIPENGVDDGSKLTLSHESKDVRPTFSWKRASNLLWEHFIVSYSNRTVLIWSIWWALSTAGFLLIINYVQLLWMEIDKDQENFFNGGVEALLTLFGAIGASVAGHVFQKSFEKYDMYILTICSFLQGGLTIVSSLTDNVWIAYAIYIVVGLLFHFTITLVTAFVAKFISEDSFALIFGINTLLAVTIQTLFTVIFVTDTASLDYSPREQFLVFGIYFIALGILYLLAILLKCFRK